MIILTDDAILAPGALATIRGYLRQYPDVGAILSHISAQDMAGGTPKIYKQTFEATTLVKQASAETIPMLNATPSPKHFFRSCCAA